jgi:hypothetical protein
MNIKKKHIKQKIKNVGNVVGFKIIE